VRCPSTISAKTSQDVVRLGVGLIGTVAAMVLGLLIAAAKISFDTQSSQITQLTADIILLDNLLAQYGPEGRPIREKMRSIIGPLICGLGEKHGLLLGVKT
jgi:hypothetical protein